MGVVLPLLLLLSCADRAEWEPAVGWDYVHREHARGDAPEWLEGARFGSVVTARDPRESTIDSLIAVRALEGCSVALIDDTLSYDIDEAGFEEACARIRRAAEKVHERGMKAALYIPALEVLSLIDERGESFGSRHRDWLQRGLDGTPNVFRGGEAWVEENLESAWLSPNSGFRTFFLERIRALARLPIDAIWLDVPLYLETGAEWADASKPAVQAYRSWSDARRAGSGGEMPAHADPGDPRFHDWVRFRHENLAAYVADVQRAARHENDDLVTIVEVYPMDYMDATTTGLDATWLAHLPGLAFAWEVDAVSDRDGMRYASMRDMHAQIAMFKWGAAVSRDWPGVGFSYGFDETDAALVAGVVLAAGHGVLECRIPDMTASIGSAFRARWYSWLESNAGDLSGPRAANVGVWYSSATRDRFDYEAGGYYGKYVELEPVVEDSTWWASHPGDSPIPKPHFGGWRAAAHFLLEEQVPFRPLVERPAGARPDGFDGLDWIWLPSVRAMSREDAGRIREFARSGGRVLATGGTPATHDTEGRPHAGGSLLADLFPAGGSRDHVAYFGEGFTLDRPRVTPEALFARDAHGDSVRSVLRRNLLPHIDPVVRMEEERVYLEIIEPVDGERSRSVAIVDLVGVERPTAPPDRSLTLHFRPPPDARRIVAYVSAPGASDRRIPVERLGGPGTRDSFVSLSVRAAPFALVTFRWEHDEAGPPVLFAGHAESPAWLAEPIESAVAFVKGAMRNDRIEKPWSYGIHTNLAEFEDRESETYVYGDYVTSEHMGLALRIAARTGDRAFFEQSAAFVREVMQSRAFRVLNWAIDERNRTPHREQSEIGWIQANAPFDDLRVVRGLQEGGDAFGIAAARELAEEIARGLYETSVVTDVFAGRSRSLIAYAFDFIEGNRGADVSGGSPGFGITNGDPLPCSYQDLYTIGSMARRDPRWRTVLRDATDFLLAAEIGATGLFWSGWSAREQSWIGDFEYRDDPRGRHLKTIQMIWCAIHLAEGALEHADLIGPERTGEALFSARRTLRFFQDYYETHGSVPEYLTIGGQAVDDCPEGRGAANGTAAFGLPCLRANEENLTDGEARIDALLARLAIILEDYGWAHRIVRERILPDRVSAPDDPRYGFIGRRSVDTDDADAWNVLESVLTMRLLAEEADGS